MRCSKEYRKWVNNMRKRWGKTNGVIPSYGFDSPVMERKFGKAKGKYKRTRVVAISSL